ncbi:MAG: fumarate hydratase C-terminal domain-containing protein [Candidatus Bathyarchaeia archaeon]
MKAIGMGREVRLRTPLEEDAIRDLGIGDIVYLDGKAFAIAYAFQFQRALDELNSGKSLPMDFGGSAILHFPTCFKEEGGRWRIVYFGPTTSSKFNKVTPEFVRRFKIRAIVGKGGMDDAVMAAMREVGCVFLQAIGGCSVIYTKGVDEITNVYWQERHWTYAVVELKLRDFGPLIVTMDAKGRRLGKEERGP